MLNAEVTGATEANLVSVAPPGSGSAGSIICIKKKIGPNDLDTDLSTAFLLPDKLKNSINFKSDKTYIFCSNIDSAFIQVLGIFNPYRDPDPRNYSECPLEGNVQIGRDCSIGQFCIIRRNAHIGSGAVLMGNNFIGEHVHIGNNSLLYPGVVVLDGCRIGSNVILHSNTVVGSDGFGYTETSEGIVKIPQIGNVIIGDNAEIGSNTSIDRSTIGSTIIENNVKIDNLVQIAHNTHIGENTRIAGQTGVAGSAKIGKNVIIGGQAAIGDHSVVGDRVILAGRSGVYPRKHVIPGSVMFGEPLMPIKDALQVKYAIKHIPEIMKRFPDVFKPQKKK